MTMDFSDRFSLDIALTYNQGPVSDRWTVTIEYTDSNGKFTERDITPLYTFPGREGEVLAAYCHLRQELRNFSLSRIGRVWYSTTPSEEVYLPQKVVVTSSGAEAVAVFPAARNVAWQGPRTLPWEIAKAAVRSGQWGWCPINIK